MCYGVTGKGLGVFLGDREGLGMFWGDGEGFRVFWGDGGGAGMWCWEWGRV